MERAGKLEGVLSRHGVCNEQDLFGLDALFHLDKLFHERFVSMKTSLGVQDERVVPRRPEEVYSLLGERKRAFWVLSPRVDVDVERLCERKKLFERRRTLDVRRGEERLEPFAFQVKGQLCRRGRFTRALDSYKEDDVWRGAFQGEVLSFRTEQRLKLFVDNRQQVLVRGERLEHALAQSLLANTLQKGLGHLKMDVRLKQRPPDFPEYRLYMPLFDDTRPLEGSQGLV